MSNKFDEFLSKLDNFKEPFSEFVISRAIQKWGNENKDLSQTEEYIAELIAFDFCENYQNEETGWGTYYGPKIVWPNEDGTASEYPSIRKVTNSIIDYWINRAQNSTHPILKYRYADLVWDFSREVIGKGANPQIAYIVIENAIEIAKRNCHKYESEVIDKLKRALDLALKLSNKSYIRQVSETMIDYEDKISDDKSLGLCGFSYDNLINHNKVLLKDDQRQKIINDMESRLDRVANPLDDKKPDPWIVEHIACRLAQHYNKINERDKLEKILNKFECAIEKFSVDEDAFRSQILFQNLYKIYKQYGFKESVERIGKNISELGPKVVSGMKGFSTPIEISKEAIEQYKKELVDGGMEEAFKRLTAYFIPNKNGIKNQLLKDSKQLFQFHIPKVIINNKGIQLASIGSIDTDLDGNIVSSIVQDFGLSLGFLNMGLDIIFKEFNITHIELLDYIYKSPIFETERKEIISNGLQAYFEKNYLVAIHLLIPQIENAIRNLFIKMGGSIIKKRNKYGGYDVKNLGDLLCDSNIENFFKENAILYLKVLYIDPRGWNLRNRLCHGLSDFGEFSFVVADRIIHTLLLLSLI
jgi:hypothetical protein